MQQKQQQQQPLGRFRAAVALLALARPSAVPSAAAAVRVASRCSAAPDAVDCLLRAAAAGVDALARSAEPVQLVPGCVALVKSAGETEGPPPPPPGPLEDVERRSAEDAGDALVDSVTAFAKSRAISVRAPGHLLDSLKNALTEARGKKDKYAGPLLMGAMMVAGTLLPIKLGALAMMSGKALMTSMLALMLAAILALKKLASGGGGGGGGSHGSTTYEVINVPSHTAHGSHGRSLAHSLAYGLPIDPTATQAAAVPPADAPRRR